MVIGAAHLGDVPAHNSDESLNRAGSNPASRRKLRHTGLLHDSKDARWTRGAGRFNGEHLTIKGE